MNFIKNNLILVFVVVLIFSVARIVSGANDSLLVSSRSTDKLLGSDLLSLLLELKSVKIDGSIFSEKTFTNLKDFSTKIQDQSIGRSNPFNEIGVNGSDKIGFSGSSSVSQNLIGNVSTTSVGFINSGNSQVDGI